MYMSAGPCLQGPPGCEGWRPVTFHLTNQSCTVICQSCSLQWCLVVCFWQFSHLGLEVSGPGDKVLTFHFLSALNLGCPRGGPRNH